jgi:Mg2+ and Co2+ transporter CorA
MTRTPDNVLIALDYSTLTPEVYGFLTGRKNFVWNMKTIIKMTSLTTGLDVRAIAAKLDRMDTLSRVEEVEQAYSKMSSTLQKIDDLSLAADVQTQVGTESQEIARLLRGIDDRLVGMEAKIQATNKRLSAMEENSRNSCCSVM